MRTRIVAVTAATLSIVLAAAGSATAQVLINEVLYDPDGSDTGLEFVELLNCGRHGVSLTGWVLETGNGANPDDWTTEWIGGDLDYVEPGEIYLIGEPDVVPQPHFTTPLDLQNGPDGVRLTDGAEPVDVVGWGEPLFAEYYEGEPAPDVTSGLSLARSPDCFDHDDNRLDLIGAAPTPGVRNAASDDLALSVRHAGRRVFETGEAVELVCVVRNVGASSTGSCDVSVELVTGEDAGVVGATFLQAELAPRDSLEAQLVWPSPPDGYHLIEASLSFGPDSHLANNTCRTSVTVGGTGWLAAVNELMHSPGEGATEWVEVLGLSLRGEPSPRAQSHGGLPGSSAQGEPRERLSLAGWSLGDDEDVHPVASGFDSLAVVAPGEFLLLARDEELLWDHASCPVVETDGWEALSADDTVALLDEFGTVVDVVCYERGWGGGRNVSLERVRPDMPADDPTNWGGSVAPEGSTPGRTNSIHLGAAPSAGALTVSPNPFTPDGDGESDRALLRLELPVARATARVTVFDLEGRMRALLADHVAVPSSSELIWDGTGTDGELLPSGLYIIYLEAIDARAGVFATAKTAVGLVR